MRAFVLEVEIALELSSCKFVGHGLFPDHDSKEKWQNTAEGIFVSVVKAWPDNVPFSLVKFSFQVKRKSVVPSWALLLERRAKVLTPGDPRWFDWQLVPPRIKGKEGDTNGEA